MEETSMNEIKSSKQYSKLISIELPQMNDDNNHQVDWHVEDLEYLNTINIQKYFPMSLNEDIRNNICQNW